MNEQVEKTATYSAAHMRHILSYYVTNHPYKGFDFQSEVILDPVSFGNFHHLKGLKPQQDTRLAMLLCLSGGQLEEAMDYLIDGKIPETKGPLIIELNHSWQKLSYILERQKSGQKRSIPLYISDLHTVRVYWRLERALRKINIKKLARLGHSLFKRAAIRTSRRLLQEASFYDSLRSRSLKD